MSDSAGKLKAGSTTAKGTKATTKKVRGKTNQVKVLTRGKKG